jgi:GNAT superfamily N-acetyltransferase
VEEAKVWWVGAGSENRESGLKIILPVPDVDEPSLFLNNAAVHPDLRRKGVGTAMVVHAKEIASETEAKVIRLDTYGGTLGMCDAAESSQPLALGLIVAASARDERGRSQVGRCVASVGV